MDAGGSHPHPYLVPISTQGETSMWIPHGLGALYGTIGEARGEMPCRHGALSSSADKATTEEGKVVRPVVGEEVGSGKDS